MYVRPSRPDLKVRDPRRGDHLPPEGREVTRSDYWLRRLRDGDVVAAEAAKPAPRKSKEESR